MKNTQDDQLIVCHQISDIFKEKKFDYDDRTAVLSNLLLSDAQDEKSSLIAFNFLTSSLYKLFQESLEPERKEVKKQTRRMLKDDIKKEILMIFMREDMDKVGAISLLCGLIVQLSLLEKLPENALKEVLDNTLKGYTEILESKIEPFAK